MECKFFEKRNNFWEVPINPGELNYEPVLEVMRGLAGETGAEPAQYFYHSDHLGSSAFITRAGGDVEQHLQYMPFSETFIDQRIDWNPRFTFTDKEKDKNTGYHFPIAIGIGARYYDSEVSVFISVDQLSSMYPSMSPYMYCRGNPVRLVDPTGMASGEPDGTGRYWIGKRIVNWVKGDSWKNRANKFAVNNDMVYSENSEGQIVVGRSNTWKGENKTGGINEKTYSFTEEGYSVTVNNSRTLNDYSNSYEYASGGAINWIQGGLDVVGLIPGLGEIADGLNAAIYLARGDHANATLSAAAMIPFAGWAATGTKVTRKALKAAKFTADQTALIKMAKTAKKTGVTMEDAKILKG